MGRLLEVLQNFLTAFGIGNFLGEDTRFFFVLASASAVEE
jgi:hypothetical protein